jgi:hypothetical protein
MIGGDSWRWFAHSARIADRKKGGKFFRGERFGFGCHHPTMHSCAHRNLINFAQIDGYGRVNHRITNSRASCRLFGTLVEVGDWFPEQKEHHMLARFGATDTPRLPGLQKSHALN